MNNVIEELKPLAIDALDIEKKMKGLATADLVVHAKKILDLIEYAESLENKSLILDDDTAFYMANYGIPTIQLGNGQVIINDLIFNDEFEGIGFSLGEGEIGESHDYLKGKMASDIGTFLQIISTKPESIQILIDKLEIAKNNFTTTTDRG